MIRSAVFIAASAALAILTQRSVRNPHSHGFYRFLAFEFLLALVLLNAPRWFRDPFSARQLVSWLILMLSAVMAAEAFRLFFKIGRPASNAVQNTNLWFENTTKLVAVGIYRYIRHPMYTSLIGLGWGAWLKHPSAIGAGLALAASVLLIATALVEERENLVRFGPTYSAYMKATRRFIPFVV